MVVRKPPGQTLAVQQVNTTCDMGGLATFKGMTLISRWTVSDILVFCTILSHVYSYGQHPNFTWFSATWFPHMVALLRIARRRNPLSVNRTPEGSEVTDNPLSMVSTKPWLVISSFSLANLYKQSGPLTPLRNFVHQPNVNTSVHLCILSIWYK